MLARESSGYAVTLPGTFNGWDLHDPAWRAEQVGEGRWELRRRLSRGRHAFKWSLAQTWDRAYGGRGSEPLIAPTQGALVRGGADIVLNVPIEGEYRFRLDYPGRRWRVEAVDDLPGPEGAVWPEGLRSTALGEVIRAARQHGENKAYGYSWDWWERVRPFLEQGGFRGFFPIRDENRVLFVFNAALHHPLFLVGGMNDWQIGPDRFERIPGTDVHLLYREYHPQSAFHYKLYDGGWFADPLNRWVIPDGQAVPMFQTGTFNSVLDLAGPANERQDALLWLREFPSVVRGNARDVWVSLPRGYATSGERYPVLYVQDGNEALTRVWLHARAREAVESGYARPCILVFVGLAVQHERGYEYADLEGRQGYADFLARELAPFIDRHFRTKPTPRYRGIVGASFGGVISYYTGWRYPDVFGCIAGQGASFYVNEWDVLRLYSETPRRDLRLYIDSARAMCPGAPRDNEMSARYAEKTLRAAGYAVKHVRRENQRHDWSSWSERFPEILHAFWPVRQG